MSYRGDDEALRARVSELETKLDDANAELARLRGERAAGDSAPKGARVEHSRVIGGPRRYEREAFVPHEIDEAGYEAIAAVLRQRLGLNASQVGRTLTVPNVFSLTREEGGVRIRLVGDFSGLAGSVLAASLLTGGFGALMSGGVMADMITHGVGWAHTVPVDLGIAAAAIGLASIAATSVGVFTRRRMGRTAEDKRAALDGTFEALLDLTEKHAVRAAPPTRVAIESAADTEADAEEEAEPSRSARSTEAERTEAAQPRTEGTAGRADR